MDNSSARSPRLAPGQQQPPAAVPIPGARASVDEERWRVTLLSAGSETASLGTSVQDGIFATSLRRRQSTEHGGTFGSLGHGAWLSSSPHPNLRAFPHRPPLHRSPSLQVGRGQVCFQQSSGWASKPPSNMPACPCRGPNVQASAGLTAHEEALEAAEAGAAAADPASPPGSAHASPAPLPAQRVQRWQATATDASTELGEPLLPAASGELAASTPRSAWTTGGPPVAFNKEIAAETAAAPADCGTTTAALDRSMHSGEQRTDLTKALVFGMVRPWLGGHSCTAADARAGACCRAVGMS